MKWKIWSNSGWILLVSTLIMRCCSVQGHRHHHGIHARCERCPPGYGVVSEDFSVEAENNGSCVPCPNDTYSSYTTYCSSCLPCSRCGEGLYIAHPCLPDRDTICDSCHTYQGPHNENYVLRCAHNSQNSSVKNQTSFSIHQSQELLNLPVSNHLKDTNNSSVLLTSEFPSTPNLELNSTIIDLNLHNVSWLYNSSTALTSFSNLLEWNRSEFHDEREFGHSVLFSLEGEENGTHNSMLTSSSADIVLIDNASYSKNATFYQSIEPGIVHCQGNDCVRRIQMRPMQLLPLLAISLCLSVLFMLISMILYAVCRSKNNYGYKVVATIEDV